jgi:hypothetical protein
MVRAAPAARARSMAWSQNCSMQARPRISSVFGQQPGVLGVAGSHPGCVAGVEQHLEVAGESSTACLSHDARDIALSLLVGS